MSVFALIQGKISREPEQRTSKNGNAFATASLRVANGNESHFWRLFVFSESAQAELMRLHEGDSVACQGTPKFEIYTPDGGAPRVSLSLTVDQVLALRQSPRECKKKDAAAPPERSEKVAPAPDRNGFATHGDGGADHFNDEIPF